MAVVRRRWVAVATLVMIGSVLGPLAATRPAGAVPGLPDLGISGEVTYTVGDDAVVHVVIDEQVTNHRPAVNGRYYYFPTIYVPVVVAAANVVATLDGRTQSVSIEPLKNPLLERAVVHLNPTLTSLQTKHLVVTYDIVPNDPRTNRFVQDNPAFASFPVFAFGDAFEMSVKVVVPQSFDVDVAGQELDREDTGFTATYTATEIDDPVHWAALVTVNNDDRLSVRKLSVRNHEVAVRSWPNDPAWSAFVAQQLQRGVPVLERLIGGKLPVDTTLTVSETATPYVYGYAGWYRRGSNSIDIGTDLDPVVILHETSHEWFNDRHFADRWVNEGLAQELSTRASQAEGRSLQQPKWPDQSSDVAVQLVDWKQPDPSDPDAQRKEQFGYNAAFYVMRGIEQEIGPVRMRAALQNALSSHEAFGMLPGHRDAHVGTLDWKTVLDDFDVVGGSHRADALFQKYVLGAASGRDVALHAALRRHYDAIAKQAGSWGVPLAVRDTIERWQDTTGAPASQRTTKAILDLRDRLQHSLAPSHLALPTTLRDSYRAADLEHIGDVLTKLRTYEPAVDALVRAERKVHAGRSIVTRLGLLGADADGHLARAERALRRGDTDTATREANAATHDVDGALRRVLIAVAVVVLAVLVVLAMMWWRRRRRRRRWYAPLTAPAPVFEEPREPVAVGAAATPHSDGDPVAWWVSEWPSAPPDPPAPE